LSADKVFATEVMRYSRSLGFLIVYPGPYYRPRTLSADKILI